MREAVELIVRIALFDSHPCDGVYGDDGEMQCNRCLIDFKRDPLDTLPEVIRTRIRTIDHGLITDEILEWRKQHVRHDGLGNPACELCATDWPCPFIKLLDARTRF